MQQKRTYQKREENSGNVYQEAKALQKKVDELENELKVLRAQNKELSKTAVSRVVELNDVHKALRHFGWNPPDLKDWWTDGTVVSFLTLGGHRQTIKLSELE